MTEPKGRRLRQGLERLERRYDARYLFTDPLAFPRRFSGAEDREVVGLVASSLAYGNVTAIGRSVEQLVGWMGPRPARFVSLLHPSRALEDLSGFQHRWSRGRDLACLLFYVKQVLDEYGSIGELFRRGYDPASDNLGEALDRFCRAMLRLDHAGLYGRGPLPPKAGVRYFFPAPGDGSACKRLNMYLRWMVRRDDGLDLGLWGFVRPAQLVIPLDTHMTRIGRHLGWTRRKSPGWKMAVEITRSLAQVNPQDPVRFDFALSRMGILERCPRHPATKPCDLCALRRSLQPGKAARTRRRVA